LWRRFCPRDDHLLLQLERLRRSEVPPPYGKLLVHSSDMTPTIETFYQQPIHLRVVKRWLEQQVYFREVTLNLDADNRPVEYGVIRIYLDLFTEAARRLIVQGERPLGAILRSEAIAHMGWPNAFFRIHSESRLESLLCLKGAAELYGRHNLLLNATRQVLAEVIEVLAPVELPDATEIICTPIIPMTPS